MVLIIFSLLTLFSFVFPKNLVFAAVSDWQQGASINPRSSTDFSSDSFRQSLSNLQSTGANYATFIIPYYQSSLSSSDIHRGWNTPTDESLTSAINYAHSLGMKVNLKIHIDSYTGEWRRHINPTDRDSWFQAYGNVLRHYASMAAQTGAEEITLGTEITEVTSTYANQSNTTYWSQIIASLRKIYNGSLTYSAQHNYPTEWNEIRFWDQLDYIGLSAYFPIDEYNNNPSLDSLKSSWKNWDNQVINPLYQQWNKPILFSEIGYKSVTGAHIEPAAWWRSGSPSQEEQARDYEALFSYWNDKSYIQGVHFWEWESDPNAGGANTTSYTPQNKQAQQVMTDWFSDNTQPSNNPAPVNNNANYSTSASLTPSDPQLNQPVQITINTKPDSTVQDIIVDAEIYDNNNSKIFQKFFEHQNIEANQVLNQYLDWIPPSTNTYTVKVGIFNNNWTTNYHWNDNAIAINTSSTPTSTPTPSPNPTTTPQPPDPSPTQIPSPSPTTTPPPEPSPTQPPSLPPPPTTTNIQIWWPTNGVNISGNQPFKALAENLPLASYQMYWQVDGGQLNLMSDNQTDYPHKEVQVDVSGWNWKNNGPYLITFIAKDQNGNNIAQTSIDIHVF